MLKKALVAAAIVTAGLGGVASAETACVDVYLDANGTVVAQSQCV